MYGVLLYFQIKYSSLPERSHCLEDGDVSGAEETGAKVDERDGDDDEIEPAPGVAEVHDAAHGEQLEGRLEEEDHGEDSIQVVEHVLKERSERDNEYFNLTFWREKSRF